MALSIRATLAGVAMMMIMMASWAALSAQQALKIIVIAGEDSVNIIQQKTAVAPIVEVRDRNDNPVAGALVTFSIQGGQNATLGGGLQSTIVMTDAAGRAAATALTPTASGAVQINVSATFQGQAATATITQTNFATAADAAKAGHQVQPAQVAAGSVSAGSAGAVGAGAASASAAGAGGGVSKLAVIGLVGGGAAGAAVAGTYFLRNTAPDVGAVTTSTSSAFLAHTPVTFQVQASDANQDSLSYAWDFGDGATATEASPVHVFTNEGSYTVRVTVGDGKASARSQLTVVIRSLTGTWRGSATALIAGSGPGPVDLAFVLAQVASSVTGTVSLSFPTLPLASFANCPISGSVGATSPRIVIQQAPCPGVGAQGQPSTFGSATFPLEPAQDVNTMTGPLGSQTITLTRQ